MKVGGCFKRFVEGFEWSLHEVHVDIRFTFPKPKKKFDENGYSGSCFVFAWFLNLDLNSNGFELFLSFSLPKITRENLEKDDSDRRGR